MHFGNAHVALSPVTEQCSGRRSSLQIFHVSPAPRDEALKHSHGTYCGLPSLCVQLLQVLLEQQSGSAVLQGSHIPQGLSIVCSDVTP